jgi:hypothetical protein
VPCPLVYSTFRKQTLWIQDTLDNGQGTLRIEMLCYLLRFEVRTFRTEGVMFKLPSMLRPHLYFEEYRIKNRCPLFFEG